MPEQVQNQTPQEKQNEGGKVKQQFDTALAKVSSILGGDGLLKPKKKVKGDVVTSIVEELTKERVEKNRELVKTELSNLLTKYVDFEVEVKKKEDELNKLKEQKQKEFIEAANKFFNKIEDVDVFAKQMESALKTAAGAEQK